MRVPKTSRNILTQVNLTPLIDVVFNLVIFFLVVSHFSQGQAVEGVNLPRATQGQVDETPGRLTVTIQADQTYLVGGRVVTTAEIEEMIEQAAAVDPKSTQVRIQGDRSAPFQLVEPIMLACAKHAITNFGFDVLPELEQ